MVSLNEPTTIGTQDSRRKRFPLCIAVGLTTLLATEAMAQAALEEVVVTARKREESLQTVPLAITALTEKELVRRSIRTIGDVAQNTPGLTYFDLSSQLSTPVIRGLSQTVIAAPDRNVALFYNGVFLSNTNASNFDLFDMERIEVVKGPVSSLYGRNAFGGAINYVPKQASLTQGLAGSVEATVGSDSRYGGRGSINLPVSDTLAIRLSGGYDESDGTIKNLRGGNVGGYEATAASWDIRWKPTDALSIGQFGFYVDDTREQTAQYWYPNNCGQVAGSGTSPANPPRPSFYCGELLTTDSIAVDPRAYGSKRDGVVAGLNIDYDIGAVTASFIGGFANLTQSSLPDRDFTKDPRGLLYYLYPTSAGPTAGAASIGTAYLKSFLGGGPDTTRDVSVELRLASNQEQAFRWMVGSSYYKHYLTRTTRFGIDSTGFTGPGVPWTVYTRVFSAFRPITGLESTTVISKNNIRDEVTAGYLNLDYDATDKLTFSGDLRYDEEKRQLNNNLIVSQQNRTDTYWTYRVSADYKFDPARMVYASVAKGVIAGFFNGAIDAAAGNLPIPANLQNYKPSTNLTYEIGGKASWLDNRLTTNVAVYYIDYKDLQITAAPPAPLVTALTTNAAAATVKGFELSIDGRVTDHFSVGIGYAYTDPKYSAGAIDLSNTRYCGIGVPAICTTNVAGNQLTRSSKNTVNAYLEYENVLTADWNWYARLDGRNQSEQYPRSVSIETYPGYTIGNARVGFSKDEKLDIALWVKNLSDKAYIATGITQPNSNPSPVQLSGNPDFTPNTVMGERRSYGVTANYRF